MSGWNRYRERVGDVPNSLVVAVLKNDVRERGMALDLGAGNLRDSKFLVESGFRRVVAVDSSRDSLDFVIPGIELHVQPIESFEIEANTFDLVISCNTLWFLDLLVVAGLFRKVLGGLKSGGIFACNMLGSESYWVKEDIQKSFFKKEYQPELCEGFEVIAVEEFHGDIPSPATLVYVPPRHTHRWSIVLRKP